MNRKITRLAILWIFLLLLSACSSDDSEPTIQYELRTDVSPAESGEVTPASGSFENGKNLVITATPAAGFVFKEWNGHISGSENPIEVTMNSSKNFTAIFQKEKFPIETQILGKWDVSISGANKTLKNSYQKQQKTELENSIFSLVFYSDETFVITHTSGEVEGSFKVKNASSIELEELGSINNIIISDNEFFGDVNIPNLYEGEISTFRDKEFEEGDCITFLECNEGSVWKSLDRDEIEFVKFNNSPTGTWLETYKFNDDRNCRLSEENNNEKLNLIGNYTISLKYTQDPVDGIKSVEYNLREDGILEGIYEGSVDTYYKYFEPSNQEILDSYLPLNNCLNAEAVTVFDAAWNTKGIALDGDHLYIAATFDNVIYRINHTQENPIPEIFLNVNMPSDIAIYDSYMYITVNPNYSSGEKIIKLNLNEKDIAVEDITDVYEPNSLVLNGNEMFVVSKSSILKIDIDTNSSTVFYNQIHGNSGLMTSENSLYATDGVEILRWDLNSEKGEAEILVDGYHNLVGISEVVNDTFFFTSYDALYSFDITKKQSMKVMEYDKSSLRTGTAWDVVRNEDYVFVSFYEGGSVLRIKVNE